MRAKVCENTSCTYVFGTTGRYSLTHDPPHWRRIELTDLRALEHDFPPVSRRQLFLQRIAFEVDGRQIGVRRGRENWDRFEEIIVGLWEKGKEKVAMVNGVSV